MVANLSAHKPGWDERWEEFSDAAVEGRRLVDTLRSLVDEDTDAFNAVMAAIQMPKGTDEEKAARAEAMEAATLYAAEVPLRTMRAAASSFGLLRRMAETGNPASVSDAGVGALAARAAVLGADLNVRINAAGLADTAKAAPLVAEATSLVAEAKREEEEILAIVNAKIG
jgi:glutamate formiminotransferase/formiminotetrahydrofolate cyclodeaminase